MEKSNPGRVAADRELLRSAWIVWAQVAFPQSAAGAWLIENLGVMRALAWVISPSFSPISMLKDKEKNTLLKCREVWLERLSRLVSGLAGSQEKAWLDVGRKAFEVAAAMGGKVLTPVDEKWPQSFSDSGTFAPNALWLKGRSDTLQLERTISLVGARACSTYGAEMAYEFAYSLATAGYIVSSGGAYGVDAAAHRGALASRSASGGTIAWLASGIDSLYPVGNTALLEQIIENGVIVSEAPPGTIPHRSLFLQRNRLVAQAQTTVVVEAAYRSGALNTARTAGELLRPVGAMPGPVTSPASAGCHQLIRSGLAVCVTGADEIIELAGPIGVVGLNDGAELSHRREILQLIPREGAEIAELAKASQLPTSRVAEVLGQLMLAGQLSKKGSFWYRRK